MKQKRDYSMLYAVLAGATIFFLIVYVYSWIDEDSDPPNIFYPSGSVLTEIDTFGGFPAYGVDMKIIEIPKEKADEFVRQLREEGLEETPLPGELQYTLSSDPDTRILADISNGLWWFRNDSSYDGGMLNGRYTSFTFIIYDLDSYTYYHMKYVF